LGFGSRMVITGDVTQVDLPRDRRSGLIAVQSVLDGVDDIAFVCLDRRDVVRHRLVQAIVDAYDTSEAGLMPTDAVITP
jgi:phosphate starvation-inducible protein PhoH and related proteins